MFCTDADLTTAPDQHSVSLVMTRLQNPINRGFEALNRSLADVSKAQKKFGRALDKVGNPTLAWESS